MAAYLYYVDAEKPIGETEEKPKVFAVEADQIEELKVSTIAGGVAELKKSADGWYLTGPQQIRADDSEVTGITGNLASVAIQRVVEENPANLGDYGLREPVAEVSFKAKGAKEFTTLQIGTKTPTGSDLYAKTANDKKVFLISGYLESTLNRTPFDLRDKKIISFDRDKVDRIEIRHGKSLVEPRQGQGRVADECTGGRPRRLWRHRRSDLEAAVRADEGHRHREPGRVLQVRHRLADG